jgi:hypothetical protein
LNVALYCARRSTLPSNIVGLPELSEARIDDQFLRFFRPNQDWHSREPERKEGFFMRVPWLFIGTLTAIPWEKIPWWGVASLMFLAITVATFIGFIIWEFVGRIELLRRERDAFEVRFRPRR